MTYALIDNASLTAVDRATGHIVAKNPDTINGDLAAFENLVQAILFYDNLVSIDNYKEEFRDERAKRFSFINFLASTNFGLSTIDELAKREAASIKPEIRGGEFSDKDFKELVEMLKLNMVCTWDMRSSVYYLTMKMLGQPNTPEYEKYSELSASIFNELSDSGETKGPWSTNVTLISASGHIYLEQEFREQKQGLGGTTRALDMFIAALNWMAYKSIYYSIAAKHLKADSFIHPIRHAYQIHWMKKTGAFGHDFTSRLIGNLSNKIGTSVSEIIDHGRVATITLDLPIFSAWLTQESGGIEGVIASALELKKADQFDIARQTIREIKIAYDEDGISLGNANVLSRPSRIERCKLKMGFLRLYLDNCCFNRPYDDQSTLSVYLETQAKLHIQEQVKKHQIELVWSFILTAENEANPDHHIRDKIADWMDLAMLYVPYSLDIETFAANMMERNGIDAKDALHVACAVESGCEFLLTTDKKLIKRTGRIDKMRVLNPAHFVTDYAEYIDYEK